MSENSLNTTLVYRIERNIVFRSSMCMGVERVQLSDLGSKKMFTSCNGFQCLIPNNLFPPCDHSLISTCITPAAWTAHTFKYTDRYKNITYVFRLRYFVVACG